MKTLIYTALIMLLVVSCTKEELTENTPAKKEVKNPLFIKTLNHPEMDFYIRFESSDTFISCNNKGNIVSMPFKIGTEKVYPSVPDSVELKLMLVWKKDTAYISLVKDVTFLVSLQDSIMKVF